MLHTFHDSLLKKLIMEIASLVCLYMASCVCVHAAGVWKIGVAPNKPMMDQSTRRRRNTGMALAWPCMCRFLRGSEVAVTGSS
jgi:hypothetical protein